MSTHFDDFIRNNRDEFDSELPSAAIWDKVADRISPQQQQKVKPLFSVRWAAAAVLVIGIGLTVYFWKSSTTPQTGTLAQTDTIVSDTALMNDINPDYAKEVYHFTQLIELKQSEIKQLEKEQPALYKEFVGDIKRLDSSYISLKQELPTNPNREQLLEAMIQNLKLQMDLLNQQLGIIQQIKQSKNKHHESNSKSI